MSPSRIPGLLLVAALTACSAGSNAVPSAGGAGQPVMGSSSAAVPRGAAQHLYVANGSAGTVTVYAIGSSKPAYTIANGVFNPHALAFDSTGNLYVANYARQTVTEYAKGTGTLIATMSAPNLYYPGALTLDRKDNLYVGAGSYTVVFAAKTHERLRTMKQGTHGANGIALDKAGNVYVVNYALNAVVYAAGGTTVARTITQELSWPIRMALDARGNLWIVNVNSGLKEYAPGSSQVRRSIGDGTEQPLSIAFDASGNLYDGVSAAPGYVAQYSGTFLYGRKILIGSGYGHAPVAMTTDAAGNLYVADYPNWDSNSGGGSIAIVGPGKSRPFRIITNGVNGPWALAIGP